MDEESDVGGCVKKKVCCICGASSLDLVKQFNHQTLARCDRNLSIRRARGWKFHDISLPTSIDEDIGYHSQCYKSFNAVSQKFDTETPSKNAKQRYVRRLIFLHYN